MIPIADLSAPICNVQKTHSNSIHEQSCKEAVDVFIGWRLGSRLNLIDHLLHGQSKEREGRLEDIEHLFNELPRLTWHLGHLWIGTGSSGSDLTGL